MWPMLVDAHLAEIFETDADEMQKCRQNFQDLENQLLREKLIVPTEDWGELVSKMCFMMPAPLTEYPEADFLAIFTDASFRDDVMLRSASAGFVAIARKPGVAIWDSEFHEADRVVGLYASR
eukprot:2312046-Karenia_brevis.AAC.1